MNGGGSVMPIRVTTRHGEGFDLHIDSPEPAKSPYAAFFGEQYVQKVLAFYKELGVTSAMWTTPATQPPEWFEPFKPLEYLLEINEDRVIAYVDELTWSGYLHGKCNSFLFSRRPIEYEIASVLVRTPIRKEEVKEVRLFRATRTDRCVLVETKPMVDCRRGAEAGRTSHAS
jgi:hypothetical protein